MSKEKLIGLIEHSNIISYDVSFEKIIHIALSHINKIYVEDRRKPGVRPCHTVVIDELWLVAHSPKLMRLSLVSR
jgi:hypothetical protein